MVKALAGLASKLARLENPVEYTKTNTSPRIPLIIAASPIQQEPSHQNVVEISHPIRSRYHNMHHGPKWKLFHTVGKWTVFHYFLLGLLLQIINTTGSDKFNGDNNIASSVAENLTEMSRNKIQHLKGHPGT